MSNQLSFFCEDGHEFEMAGDGYYKNDETGNRIPDVVFRMIFCLKCGENLEIIVADRRPRKETNFTMSEMQKAIIDYMENNKKKTTKRTSKATRSR